MNGSLNNDDRQGLLGLPPQPQLGAWQIGGGPAQGAVPQHGPGLNTQVGGALAQTLAPLADWIQRQRAQSAQMGLMDPNTGWPTQQGWQNAMGSYISALMGSTGAPGEAAPLGVRMWPRQQMLKPAIAPVSDRTGADRG